MPNACQNFTDQGPDSSVVRSTTAARQMLILQNADVKPQFWLTLSIELVWRLLRIMLGMTEEDRESPHIHCSLRRSMGYQDGSIGWSEVFGAGTCECVLGNKQRANLLTVNFRSYPAPSRVCGRDGAVHPLTLRHPKRPV